MGSAWQTGRGELWPRSGPRRPMSQLHSCGTTPGCSRSLSPTLAHPRGGRGGSACCRTLRLRLQTRPQ
eukprot:1377017-Lingulodinium_polyedra.AAC.1